MRRSVFLDRDGTLNEAPLEDGRPRSPLTISELVLHDGVGEGVERLRHAGFELVIVTNQPNVPRGLQTRGEVEAINHALMDRLGIEHVYVCWHDDGDLCDCRKPKPGLLLRAAHDLDVDLQRSFMVGDRGKDAAAGVAAGCRAVLIDHGYAGPEEGGASIRVRSFRDAVDWILRVESA